MLPLSGTITLADVNVELGLASTTNISLNQANVRALAGIPSGTISMSNLYGKYATVPIQYVVVAGGGGGGDGANKANNGGGGGAGGVRTATGYSVPIATTLTVTVGAGGTRRVSGSNSVFYGITSTGGGGGGGTPSAPGLAGGSGGGGGTAGAGAGGAGTSGQGANGSTGGGANNAAGGGGGAAPQAGGVRLDNGVTNGNGGNGLAVFNGATYGGGGGGGSDGIRRTGGAGGGAYGALYFEPQCPDATPNTGGGGGGGASRTASVPGSTGGSGIVVIQYPNTYGLATATTGSPAYVNTGGFHRYTWTSSGSITF